MTSLQGCWQRWTVRTTSDCNSAASDTEKDPEEVPKGDAPQK
jgi:hypothetical protein